VIAIVLFLGFWVILALGLVFVALRGGLGGARQALHVQTHGGRRVVSTIFAITYVGFGFALPLVFLLGNHAHASRQYLGVRLTAAEKHGRQLFGEHCGVCHTLNAANAAGKVGPNLDVLKPPAALTLNTINNGCLQNPPPNSPQTCLGYGTMPPAIIQGKDAQDVAAFVARVAGR
jgi:hypothetical protein